MLKICGKPLLFILVVYTLTQVSQCKRKRTSPLTRININSKVRGFYDESENGRIFRSFTGIPYAEPPVGDLRFKAPEPSQGWLGILNATDDPPMCLQRDIYFTKKTIMTGSEDCLYLNVFAPPLSRKYRIYYPVMVFIHGPTFSSGSSSFFRPHRLLNQDVVLVTFNYRLGILGFLSTEDESASGNWGLLDQVEALKWVQQHIESFGGDPKRVTLFGQGAGARAVSLHQFSPLSKGLFHSAIIQSDSFLCQSKPTYSALTNARLLARELNCPHDDKDDMIYCLKSRNANHFFDIPEFPSTEWQPRVDAESKEPFLAENPKVLMTTSGPLSPVPVIIGAPQAYLLAHGPDSLFGRAESSEPSEGRSGSLIAIQEMVMFVLFTSNRWPGMSDFNREMITNGISETYFPNLRMYARNIAELYADAHKNPCLYQTAVKFSKFSPTWFYSFDHVGNVSFTDDDNLPTASVFWDDLLYLFRIENRSEILVPRDNTLSSIFVQLFTDFARYDDPTPPGNYLNVRWNRVSNGQVPYLSLRQPLQVEHDFHPWRMHLWLKNIGKNFE